MFDLDRLSTCNLMCFKCPCPTCPGNCRPDQDNSDSGPYASMLRPIPGQANNVGYGSWSNNQQGTGHAYGQGYGSYRPYGKK